MCDNFRILCQLCSANTSAEMIDNNTIDWSGVWQLALRHRVVPVMAHQMKALNIFAPDDISRLINQHIRENLLKGMKQSAELAKLAQLFEKQDIPFLTFKGLAFNHLAGINLTQRHNGDIDLLLVNFDDIERADELLTQIGYQRLTLPKSLKMNTQEQKHFMKYEKDVIYHHPLKKISLELHFKLFQIDRLLPITNQEIYANRSVIKIGTTQVPVMSKDDHLLYLLVHGSWSRWFRLKWLCDIPLLSNNGIDYQSHDFLNRSKLMGVTRIIGQGLGLSNELLKMPIDSFIHQEEINSKITQKLINYAKYNMIASELYNQSLLEKIFFWVSFTGFYLPRLRSDTSYKRDYFKSYLMSVSDWEILPLPASLFWLYYLLRPFLWLKRQF